MYADSEARALDEKQLASSADTFGPHLGTDSCKDKGGYGGYSSAFAACSAARSQQGFIAVANSATILSVNALLYAVLVVVTHGAHAPPAPPPEEWRELEGAWLVAWLCVGGATACLPLFIASVLAGCSAIQGSHSTSLFAFIANQQLTTVQLAFWLLALLFFNAPFLWGRLNDTLLTLRKATTRRIEVTLRLDGEGDEPVDLPLARAISRFVQQEHGHSLGHSLGQSRFDSEARELKMGQLEDAALGVKNKLGIAPDKLSDLMRRNVKAIEKEVTAMGTPEVHHVTSRSSSLAHRRLTQDRLTQDRECLAYVMHGKAGSSTKIFPNSPYPMDCGKHGVLPQRKTLDGRPMSFDDFVHAREAEQARLAPAHVLALRLCIPIWGSNRRLADGAAPLPAAPSPPHRDRHHRHVQEHQWAAAPRPRAAPSALHRLLPRQGHQAPARGGRAQRGRKETARPLARAEEPLHLRHLREGRRHGDRPHVDVPQIRGSNPDSQMHTSSCCSRTRAPRRDRTSDWQVAVRYSLSSHSLIFKLATSSNMDRGADLAWCSAFPGEKEFLFPPLTYLKPTGRREEVQTQTDADGFAGTITVVEVEPTFAT